MLGGPRHVIAFESGQTGRGVGLLGTNARPRATRSIQPLVYNPIIAYTRRLDANNRRNNPD